jgi:hypothetical protein
MRFANLTPLPAALVPCAEGGDDMTALVISSATFAITPVAEGKTRGPNTGLELVRAQRPLERGSARIEPGDDHFIREGVSVTASGFVYAPGGKATKADASLEIGEEKRNVRAFGPRVWQEGVFGALSPTAPRPFDRVPMGWELAYGGFVLRKTTMLKHEGRDYLAPEHPVASPYNADGLGFYLERVEALEKPLPQLENPDDPIRNWDDRPHPVCFSPYAMNGGMRPMSLLVEDKVDMNRMGRLTCRAAPWLIFPAIAPGTAITLRGMRPRGEALAFVVPEPPVRVRVVLGRAMFELAPRLDAVDIDAEAAEARLVYRAIFRFGLVQHERREVTVEPSAAFPSPGSPVPLPARAAAQKV